MSKQTCTECGREYPVSVDERRLRGRAADKLCASCQVVAAHDAWGDAAMTLRVRAA